VDIAMHADTPTVRESIVSTIRLLAEAGSPVVSAMAAMGRSSPDDRAA
jgi:hypothetical protein